MTVTFILYQLPVAANHISKKRNFVSAGRQKMCRYICSNNNSLNKDVNEGAMTQELS